jgi:Spy/CpxP family protein refolding chaperone
MKRSLVITLSAILILLGSMTVAAQNGPHPGPGGPPPGMSGGGDDALAAYLSLTAEQRAAWATTQSSLRTTLDSFRTQEQSLGDQLKTALEGTDAAAIGNLMLQMKTIHVQIDAARAAADAQFAASLTDEQKVKFAAFQAAVEFLHSRGPR